MNRAIKILASAASRLVRLPTNINNYVDNKRMMNRCIVQAGAMLYPGSRVLNNQSRESVVVGARSRILATLETLGHGGRIEIGHDCFIGENTRICSGSSITIGNRVLISHGVNIHDTNSHALSAASRARHFEQIFGAGHPKVLDDVPTTPVVVEDDAWIGFGASVLKGVTIGRGAIVGACSLVTKDVAPFTIVVGNPARVVGASTP